MTTTIHQVENTKNEIEIIKKKIEIFEFKNTINKIKNSLKELNIRFELAEESANPHPDISKQKL